MTLEAAGVTLRRAGRTILDNISLAARPGEFVALVGPNGAGKSLLLAVLAGVQRPDAGEVRLDGLALARPPDAALARRRAYVPQSPLCEWPITVERLVALGLLPSLPGIGRLALAAEAAVTRALAACDLLDRRTQPATTLSGGELARAMLARAMVGEPDVLILDEPAAGLDPSHALDTMRRLRRLADDGRTVIASMHDLTFATRHATRIVALRQGRVIGDTTHLDANLIRATFDITARIIDGPSGPYVDFLDRSG